MFKMRVLIPAEDPLWNEGCVCHDLTRSNSLNAARVLVTRS